MLEEYQTLTSQRYSDIERMIDDGRIESWLRFTQYSVIQEEFLKAGMSNVDDNKIILDAHDLCINSPCDLSFITGDYNDIKAHERTIVNLTEIKEVIYLADINNNQYKGYF